MGRYREGEGSEMKRKRNDAGSLFSLLYRTEKLPGIPGIILKTIITYDIFPR